MSLGQSQGDAFCLTALVKERISIGFLRRSQCSLSFSPVKSIITSYYNSLKHKLAIEDYNHCSVLYSQACVSTILPQSYRSAYHNPHQPTLWGQTSASLHFQSVVMYQTGTQQGLLESATHTKEALWGYSLLLFLLLLLQMPRLKISVLHNWYRCASFICLDTVETGLKTYTQNERSHR